jgi:8-hydroxy-5-deazaflavin:NADPH oxidoreductase
MHDAKPVLAIIGGTGKLGSALARRWARAGYRVMLGSRDGAKSRDAASALQRELGVALEGSESGAAAAAADIVVLPVPFAAQTERLAEIAPFVAGKIVVDTTVPLMPPKVMRVQLPPEDSAAVRAQQFLGDAVTVVSAFHNVAAHRLATDDAIDCDVLVFGDDKVARARVVQLADDIGLRGLHGGALVNSVAAEALTSVLVFINRAYRVDGAGLRITGNLQQGLE